MKKIIFSLPIILILNGCSLGPYEGMSSKEWADEAYSWEGKYNSFKDCAEDYDNLDLGEKIDWGGVLYYCE